MATNLAHVTRNTARRSYSTAKAPVEFGSEHGHQIFVYNHLRSNRIIYSLERSMRNKKALKQLTFVGKKTVPAVLRKDLWTPLCVLSFPNTFQGLHAYAKLREFKQLHETAWPRESVERDPKTGAPLRRYQKMRRLMDQKANSIADMAAVLGMQAHPPSEREVERQRRMVRLAEGVPRSKRSFGSKSTANVFEFQGKVEGVCVFWAHLPDAEYAATWPDAVRHGKLAVSRGTPIWPPAEGWILDDAPTAMASNTDTTTTKNSDHPTEGTTKVREAASSSRAEGSSDVEGTQEAEADPAMEIRTVDGGMSKLRRTLGSFWGTTTTTTTTTTSKRTASAEDMSTLAPVKWFDPPRSIREKVADAQKRARATAS